MNSESSFEDDIIQDDLPRHTQPPRSKFLAWHRVRKEFIRQQQWNDLISRMINRYWRNLQGEESVWFLNDDEDQSVIPGNVRWERPLRCLVIPGEDLLDMRALWRDISEHSCFIRYLGFNESYGSDQQGTRVHVANNAVTSLDRVAKDSFVTSDRFESIALDNSQAYRYLKEYGPFHVVNLDLCGSIFPNTAKDPAEYYTAFNRLLAYQFENQNSEWLLFVTTMVEPAMMHHDGMQALCGPTRENFKNHPDFANLIKGFLAEAAFNNVAERVNLAALSESELINLFSVAFGKWLLALCHKCKPQWTVAMRKSFRYSMNDEKGAVMLSFAYSLKPNTAPPVDETGMSQLTLTQKRHPDERECAVKLATSVSNMTDVDQLLAADSSLKERLTIAHADLLEAAGYDKAEYLKWVQNGEVVEG